MPKLRNVEPFLSSSKLFYLNFRFHMPAAAGLNFGLSQYPFTPHPPQKLLRLSFSKEFASN